MPREFRPDSRGRRERRQALHRERGWHGDGAQFGAASAVLLGDLLLAWCDELLWGSGLPLAAVRRGKPVFDLMRTEVMAGQYLDLLEQIVGLLYEKVQPYPERR